MAMSPFCSLVIQNGGSVLTSSSGTRVRTGDMRSKEREGKNKFFYGFEGYFFRRQHGFEVL